MLIKKKTLVNGDFKKMAFGILHILEITFLSTYYAAVRQSFRIFVFAKS